MKIALLAPSGVPFVVGGAEKLWWGLTAYVNQHTPHELELIKLPSPERNFWEIVRSYEQFSQLDVSHFDAVISTKYPAWMVQHPNHVVYLQHKLRGLYDTWPRGMPTALPCAPAGFAPLWRLLQRPDHTRDQLDELFGSLKRLRDTHAQTPWLNDMTGLPGPLIRAVVHKLDGIALAPEQIRSYWAISKVVADRKGYFPTGADVKVLPHPSNLEGLRTGPFKQVFTASRHDGPKRIDWLIQAYRNSRSTLPFVVAGEGPQTPHLRELAQGDDRFRFVGRLTDDEMIDQYAQAALVPFVPELEDMGLITLEAMGSGKPVLTVTDAGGVTEFVVDGVNGRVVPPHVKALTKAFDDLLGQPEKLEAMGKAALESAHQVSWNKTASTLLEACAVGRQRVAISHLSSGIEKISQQAQANSGRKRLLVVNTFAVYPPDSGGKKRIFYLYSGLAEHYDVTLLNLVTQGSSQECWTFSPHYREIRVPANQAFTKQEHQLTRALGHPVTDIAALKYGDLLQEWKEAFSSLSVNADVVVCAHCYMAPFVEALWSGPVWYDAHNVEADIKADVLKADRLPADWAIETDNSDRAASCVREVASVEQQLLARAQRVLVTGESDAKRFQALYPSAFDPQKVCQAPNGTVVPQQPDLDHGSRQKLKQRLGWEGPVALFIGSYHGPNLQALEHVLAAAKQSPEWHFAIVGSVCHDLSPAACPPNVWLLGLRTEAELSVLLRAADVGLNPMEQGSGTNLKMLDYAANGVLVVSSPVGARGLDFVAGVNYWESAPTELSVTLQALLNVPPPEWNAMCTSAYAHVAQRFSWTQIAQEVVQWR